MNEQTINGMDQTVILIYPAPDGPSRRVEYQGKFVQLIVHGQQYLIFAPTELHHFHNQILAHFLADKNIPHSWKDDQTLEIRSPDITIVGGGKFRVHITDKTLELWDNSQAYGRFDGHELPQKIASTKHPWSGFDVRIT